MTRGNRFAEWQTRILTYCQGNPQTNDDHEEPTDNHENKAMFPQCTTPLPFGGTTRRLRNGRRLPPVRRRMRVHGHHHAHRIRGHRSGHFQLVIPGRFPSKPDRLWPHRRFGADGNARGRPKCLRGALPGQAHGALREPRLRHHECGEHGRPGQGQFVQGHRCIGRLRVQILARFLRWTRVRCRHGKMAGMAQASPSVGDGVAGSQVATNPGICSRQGRDHHIRIRSPRKRPANRRQLRALLQHAVGQSQTWCWHQRRCLALPQHRHQPDASPGQGRRNRLQIY